MKEIWSQNPIWLQFFDETVPQYVKKTYLKGASSQARESPFNEKDARFFQKGLKELSELFTLGQDKGSFAARKLPRHYFDHPRYRSSYLLYFFPFQTAKFTYLYRCHEKALKRVLEHGKKQSKLTWLDLGAGPGSSAFAFLFWLQNRLDQEELHSLPPIEITWVDLNHSILKDGEALLHGLLPNLPHLKEKVSIKRIGQNWQKLDFSKLDPLSMITIGNALNEKTIPLHQQTRTLLNWLTHSEGGGMLFLEPAFRSSAQNLSQLRDNCLEQNPKIGVWGPCLHNKPCPLASGNEWCHFSEQVSFPSKWFRRFSRALGSERHWLKFSYLWLTAKNEKHPQAPSDERLVLSDPITSKREKQSFVYLCEPNRPRILWLSKKQKGWPRRGERIRLREYSGRFDKSG